MNHHSLRVLGPLLVAALAVTPGSAAGRDAMLTFKVHVPESTPLDASVFIAGNVEMLGPWDPGKIELGRIGEHLYAITLVLPVDTDLRYKFTRGSWETVEKGSGFEEIPDRELAVVGDADVVVWVENWRDFAPRREVHTVVGDLRAHFDFPATKLGNKRTILVLLPPGYDDEPDRRYPVLYMHDGQNLFDASTSYIGVEWSVDETLTRMIASGQVEPLIVVGIENTIDRAFEYTPAPDKQRGGGGAKLYADFIVNDLKPFIDRNYRTKPGREHTGVMGSSLGGLVSLFISWEYPETFTRVGAMSTTYEWADGYILDYVRGRPVPGGVRVWLDMGTAEDQTDRNGDEVPDVIERHREMRDILLGKGLSIPRTLRYVEDEGAVHNERAWAARFPRAVEFLFPAR